LAETTRAVDYATRAGDRALVQLANDEAAAYYRQALELLEAAAAPRSDTRRLELLISLGEAQRRAGDGGYRETLLAAARLAQEHGDADALARAALANTRGSLMASFGSIDAERVAVLEAALTVVAGKGDPVEARLLAILGLELILSGDRERCRRLSDAALDLARRLDDPATLAHVLLARHHTIAGPDTLAERVANTAELVRACDRLGDPVATCQASYFQVRLAMEQGDVDEAGRVLDAWERVAVEIGQPVLRWNACWARGACVLFAGRVAEAEALATESLRLAEATGQPDVDVFRLYQLYGIRYEQDRLGELRQLLSDAITHNRGMAASVAALALLECELDEPDLARARLEAMGNLAGVRIDLTWPFNMACLAAVIAYLGDTARAETVYKALAPYPGRVAGVGTTWFGSVSHYLGLLATTLGRYDEAESHFAAAQSMHERIGAPAWLARSRLEWARMLLARSQTGDVQQARELLAKALATARQLGLAGIERLAVSLLHDES
jgi:tetratricopeptide (TPR) repeat protein